MNKPRKLGRPYVGEDEKPSPQWGVTLPEETRERVQELIRRRYPNGAHGHARGQTLRDLVEIGLMVVENEMNDPM